MNLWLFIQKDQTIRIAEVRSTYTVGSADSNQIRIPDSHFPPLIGQFIEESGELLYCDFENRERRRIANGWESIWKGWSVSLLDFDSLVMHHKDAIIDSVKILLKESPNIEGIIPRISKDWFNEKKVPEDLQLFIQSHLQELACHSPIEKILEDEKVTDILADAYDSIWMERGGVLSRAPYQFTSPSTYSIYIENILAHAHKSLDESSPFVDFTLPGGARGHVIGPPTTLGEYYLSIRKIRKDIWSLDELHKMQMFSEPLLLEIKEAVSKSKNILVSGATGSGKTTLLKAILQEIKSDQRLVVIEDAVELKFNRPNSSFLYTRQDARGLLPAISLRDLVRQALRMRPDRIIIGEVRGAEAMDLLHAMNTGHRGCIASVHANSTRDALSRLQGLVRMSSASLSESLVQEWIGKNIQFLLHCGRNAFGQRRIIESAQVRGVDGSKILLEVKNHEVSA